MVKRAVTLVAVAAAVLLLGACSSGRAEEAMPPAGQVAEGAASAGQLESSPEFQAAWQRVKQCMQLRGYSGYGEVGNVTRLKDGSLFDPQPGEAMTGPAITEYHLDRLDCNEESGLAELLPGGVPDMPREPIERMNRSQRAFYGCMAAAGWEIPQPVEKRGWVIYYLNERTAEEDAAWDLDAAACGAR